MENKRKFRIIRNETFKNGVIDNISFRVEEYRKKFPEFDMDRVVYFIPIFGWCIFLVDLLCGDFKKEWRVNESYFNNIQSARDYIIDQTAHYTSKTEIVK